MTMTSFFIDATLHFGMCMNGGGGGKWHSSSNNMAHRKDEGMSLEGLLRKKPFTKYTVYSA